jgi:hypothetical protein
MTDLARALDEVKQAMREYFAQVTQRGPTPLLAQARLKIAAKRWAALDFAARNALPSHEGDES